MTPSYGISLANEYLGITKLLDIINLYATNWILHNNTLPKIDFYSFVHKKMYEIHFYEIFISLKYIFVECTCTLHGTDICNHVHGDYSMAL